MNTSLSTSLHQLTQVAWTIDQRGIDAIPAAALRELGFQALSAGASHVLADVLIDTSAPKVARQRAYGRIASLLADPAPKTAACSPCAA